MCPICLETFAPETQIPAASGRAGGRSPCLRRRRESGTMNATPRPHPFGVRLEATAISAEFALSDDQELFRDTVRRIARDRVAPRAAAIDATGEFPWDIVALFRETGLLGVGMPASVGGGGGDLLTTALAIEEMARVCATSSLIIAVQHLGALPLMLAATPAQRERWLAPVARGEALAAFALTEPEAGSDAGAARLTAQRHGDGWVLHGTKVFITHGSVAGVIVVFAATPEDGPRSMTAFVVAGDAPGLRVGRLEDKLGIRASPTAELVFDGVAVGDDQRLGAVGEGFKIAMRTLDRSRLGIAAQALGIAEGALALARRHLATRRQFGRRLEEFQGLQWMVADLATHLEAGRQLLYRACAVVEAAGWGEVPAAQAREATRLSAMAKLFLSDAAMRTTTDAVQLLGGYGYVRDYQVERFMRDAKITQIYEGTNQVQRMVIFRHLEDPS
jgi:alkylation response protein AidB-like acyl-CoA dehydrogenase